MLDYWILAQILSCSFRPRLLVLEYNSQLGPGVAWSVPRGPGSTNRSAWDHTDYCGASLLAYSKLVRSYGYILIYAESAGVNAFFVHQSVLRRVYGDNIHAPRPETFAIFSNVQHWVEAIWRPPAFRPWRVDATKGRLVPKSSLSMRTHAQNLPNEQVTGRCAPRYKQIARIPCFGNHHDGYARSMVAV